MNYRHRQRGVAALTVSILLLLGMTIVAFFANKGMVFEQRTSANQFRATKAFEMADAGIEWAIARLNDPLTLTANSCTAGSATGLVSFRDRYVRPTVADATHPTGWLNALSTAFPGCEVNPATGVMSCACPSTAAGTLTNVDWPRFRVQFNAVTSPSTDFLAVEIISRGCTNANPCDPSVDATNADGTSIARVILKLRPTFPTVPGAGLISGSTTVVSGSLNVVNTDTASNGITINTGSTVQSGAGTTVQTLPGSSPTGSILDNDPSLLNLTNADASGELFFSSFFGEGFSDFQTNLQTKVLSSGAGGSAGWANGTCGNSGDCGGAVSYWVDRGVTQFWVVPDVSFGTSNMPSTTTGNTLGTKLKPLALASPGQVTFNGGITAYGNYYAATATSQDDLLITGGGNATIVGSLISRGDFAKTGNGNFSVIYDAGLFGGKGPPSGLLVPVPGSWRDKATAY